MKNIRFKNLFLFFIIIIILLISIIPYIFFKSDNAKLYITVNGIDMTEQYISKDNMSDENDDNKKIITIETEYGTNKIEISADTARCIYSDCKNQICVHTGFINKQFDNQMIICSPHRLVVGFK